MPFIYTGIDPQSARVKGKINANSEREVVDFLRQNHLTPLSIKKINDTGDFLMFKKVSNADVILFTRQLSSMILTGLTLVESLKILKQQGVSEGMQEVIADLIAQVSEGTAFSDALSTHSQYFPEVYIALIKAAEKGGLLDKILTRLADNMESADDLHKKVKSAMFYPTIVIVAMGVVLIVMNGFVIPQLGNLYDSLNLKLPFITRIVIDFSKIFTNYFLVLIIMGVVGFFLYNRFKKTEEGIRIIDASKLRIPVLGKINELSQLDEITRTLSILISSGASIIESLNITANVADNYWYKNAMQSASGLVEKGIPMSDAFAHQNIFPPMMVQMVKVGESTGKIDESLLKVSEYFERDLSIRIKTLTTAIEPILIIFLGVSVAFLTISVITPIYGLISQIQ
ncbi:MAG TPA: type II secretion system F family protein [Patescibacteria group bacterium]|nr:type II secretion system F family protein [Patescibacteria group bacterium]